MPSQFQPPQITADWIQGGELGLAFAVVALFSFLVYYVLHTSARRERQLMEFIVRFQPMLQKLADELARVSISSEAIIAKIDHVEGRLAHIENQLPDAQAVNQLARKRK